MTFWTFLRDQWRIALFYLGGNFLLAIVLVFAKTALDQPLPLAELAYAELLAAFVLMVYIFIEYWIRRPFYRELLSRLQREMSISEGDIPLPAGTAEQHQYARLLAKHHAMYMRKLAELEERQQFFETFTIRFAHQMKTPVTAIRLLEQEMSHVEEIQVDEGALHLQYDRISQLAVEASRIESSIDAMMYTARLNAFSFDARMETIDIPTVLRDVVNHHKAEWIRRKIFPRLECAESHVNVVTDRKWFSFMVDQIARNALQYGYRTDTEGNPCSAPFVLQVRDNGSHVQVQLIDEGIGIPERDVRHVFDPFYTGANGRTHSRATGMGLYLVREVADKLGHEVSILSKEGVGTTVTITILKSDYYQPATISRVNVTKM